MVGLNGMATDMTDKSGGGGGGEVDPKGGGGPQK